MNGYQCLACDSVFETPEYRRELEKIDEKAAFYVVAKLCPVCESDDLREVALCIDCHENGVDVLAEIEDYCKPCAELNDLETGDEFRRDFVKPVKPLVRA